MSRNQSRRFNPVWDWEEFGVGFGIMKPHRCTGWKLCIGLNLTFFSLWVYFSKIEKPIKYV